MADNWRAVLGREIAARGKCLGVYHQRIWPRGVRFYWRDALTGEEGPLALVPLTGDLAFVGALCEELGRLRKGDAGCSHEQEPQLRLRSIERIGPRGTTAPLSRAQPA